MIVLPRKVLCAREAACRCEGVNRSDPCERCPQGHFGRMPQCFQPQPAEPALPGMGVMAKNAAKAMGAVFVSGAKKVAPEEKERRLAVCHGCEFFRRSDQRCSKCGCQMNWKTRLAAWHCPIGKW